MSLNDGLRTPLMDMPAFENRLIEIQGSEPPGLIADGMTRALAGGKRIRPRLVLSVNHPAELSGVLLDFAAALEMVHCSSLVLDDLPCMDDAEERRGEQCLHLSHSEAEATLIAFSLLARSFDVLITGKSEEQPLRARLVQKLSRAIGGGGMAEGQAQELRGHSANTEDISRLKTASLFSVATEGVGMALQCSPTQQQTLKDLGEVLGLAFQALDDLNDGDGETRESLESALKQHFERCQALIESLDTPFEGYRDLLAELKTLSENLLKPPPAAEAS